jgi:hypothetical protein
MFVHAKTSYDIYRLDLESREVEIFLQTPFAEGAPAVSPDGRWLLYQSYESGRDEVYVQSLEDDGGKWQISTDGGLWAQWTRGGREIIFSTADDGTLMAVEVTLEPTFSAGVPQALFDARVGLGGQRYDVTPDGNRFLVSQPMEQPGEEPLTLVQNWTRELER